MSKDRDLSAVNFIMPLHAAFMLGGECERLASNDNPPGLACRRRHTRRCVARSLSRARQRGLEMASRPCPRGVLRIHKSNRGSPRWVRSDVYKRGMEGHHKQAEVL